MFIDGGREPGDGCMRAGEGLRTAQPLLSWCVFLLPKAMEEEKGNVCAMFSLPTASGSNLRAITFSTFIGLSAVAHGGGWPVV